MPVIHLTTFIAAPIERVFDLSRSIDLHKHSMTKYKEEPVGSIINGLVKKGDEITWRAHHLFKTRILKTRITSFDRPNSFTDELLYKYSNPTAKMLFVHNPYLLLCSNWVTVCRK